MANHTLFFILDVKGLSEHCFRVHKRQMLVLEPQVQPVHYFSLKIGTIVIRLCEYEPNKKQIFINTFCCLFIHRLKSNCLL